jgi:hypothetical protein
MRSNRYGNHYQQYPNVNIVYKENNACQDGNPQKTDGENLNP